MSSARLGALAQVASASAYRTGWRAIRWLPEPAAYRLFDRIAAEVHRRNGPRVRRLRSNYARIRPSLSAAELEPLVLAGTKSYFRYWCDAFRLPTLSPDRIVSAIREDGMGQLHAATARGGGAVGFLGHCGNWDLGGAWSCLRLAQVTTVAERLRPETLYDEFVAFRSSLGMRIIPLSGGGPVFPQLVTAVRDEGAWVPLLADRDLGAQGLSARLLGQEVRVAAGPAALALVTGAPLFAVMVHYEPAPPGTGLGGWRTVLTSGDPIPVPAQGTTREKVAIMTQSCVDVLGQHLQTHLVDWHMMQRVFATDLATGEVA